MEIPTGKTLIEVFWDQIRHRTRYKWSHDGKVTAIRQLFLEYDMEQRQKIASYIIGQSNYTTIITPSIRDAFLKTYINVEGWKPFEEAFEEQKKQWKRQYDNN